MPYRFGCQSNRKFGAGLKIKPSQLFSVFHLFLIPKDPIQDACIRCLFERPDNVCGSSFSVYQPDSLRSVKK